MNSPERKVFKKINDDNEDEDIWNYKSLKKNILVSDNRCIIAQNITANGQLKGNYINSTSNNCDVRSKNDHQSLSDCVENLSSGAQSKKTKQKRYRTPKSAITKLPSPEQKKCVKLNDTFTKMVKSDSVPYTVKDSGLFSECRNNHRINFNNSKEGLTIVNSDAKKSNDHLFGGKDKDISDLLESASDGSVKTYDEKIMDLDNEIICLDADDDDNMFDFNMDIVNCTELSLGGEISQCKATPKSPVLMRNMLSDIALTSSKQRVSGSLGLRNILNSPSKVLKNSRQTLANTSKYQGLKRKSETCASTQQLSLLNYFSTTTVKRTESRDKITLKNFHQKVSSAISTATKSGVENILAIENGPSGLADAIAPFSFTGFSDNVSARIGAKNHCVVSHSTVENVTMSARKLGYHPSNDDGYNPGRRQCPFYKKIPGTGFAVDAFSYGMIEDCKVYFLSHFHADHYCGLSKKFQRPIYCSQVTANLVKEKLRVLHEFVHPLPLNTPICIEGVEVTLFEANHCPGSVLMLFKLRNGCNYLHTGDFRADERMETHQEFITSKIHNLYLDTTYCNPSYSFPPQSDVISFAVSKTLDFLCSHPKGVVVVGTYTIGKEKIFISIAEALDSKIFVESEKKAILTCLEDTALSQRLTLNPNEARVHVMSIGCLNYETLFGHLESLRPRFDSLLAFEPTGWTHVRQKLPHLNSIRPRIDKNNITLYGVPYSEHSSYSELKRFVQFLRPNKIIPTVNNGNPRSRKKMEELFHAWLTEDSGVASPKKMLRQCGLAEWMQ